MTLNSPEGKDRRKAGDQETRVHYVAAIPLALAQADGISKDYFTIDQNGKPVRVGFFASFPPIHGASAQKLSKSFELPDTSIFHVLCNQLAVQDKNNSVVLGKSDSARPSDLNRNAIMHGESVEYGTEINSIKAILLLDFIEDLRIAYQVINNNPLSAVKP